MGVGLLSVKSLKLLAGFRLDVGAQRGLVEEQVALNRRGRSYNWLTFMFGKTALILMVTPT